MKIMSHARRRRKLLHLLFTMATKRLKRFVFPAHLFLKISDEKMKTNEYLQYLSKILPPTINKPCANLN